jgi:hypothetical protein
MVKIEGGKSTRWYENHCCLCKRELKPQNARVKGTATMMDDSVIAVIYCEPCAKQAAILQACEDLGKGVVER